MKNSLLIWNVLLTLVIGYLLFAHFNTSKRIATVTGDNKIDSLRPVTSFRIAYFEMDSVEANFNMVKDVKAELSRKEESINAELEGLSKKFQQRYNYLQNQAASGTFTQKDRDDASLELKNLDDQIKARKDQLNQEYGNFANGKMKDIKTTIEQFVKEYNANRNYSYIVAEEPGFFYYKDSAFNITGDVIKGLNEKYKTNKKN